MGNDTSITNPKIIPLESQNKFINERRSLEDDLHDEKESHANDHDESIS